MKRATLTAIPASAPANTAGDLTDRLLNREPVQSNAASGAKAPGPAKAPPTSARPRARRAQPRPAESGAAPAEADALGQALQAAQNAVEALQLAGRTDPARYEVALRFRLDSLAHHVQQVKDYVAAVSAR